MKTKPEAKHTPTPWKYSSGGIIKGYDDDEAVEVAVVYQYEGPESPSDANADFIIRAVNEHDDNQETLELQARQLQEFLKENKRLRDSHEALLEVAKRIDELYDDILQKRLPNELRFKLKEAIAQEEKKS